MKFVVLSALLTFNYFVCGFVEEKLNLNYTQQDTLQFNEQDIITYAYASSLAYCDYKKVMDFNCGTVCEKLSSYKVVKIFKSREDHNSITFVFLYNNKNNELVVTFQGTNNTQQLIDEIKGSIGILYDIHSIGQALVHSYFYNFYVKDLRQAFQQHLKETLENQALNIKKLTFTGHSLGGAMTLHAISDAVHSGLLNRKQYDVSVYTFGQPRIGDDTFNQALLGKIMSYKVFRVVNYNDLVPHLPPCNPVGTTSPVGACKKSGQAKIYYPYHLPTEIWYKDNFASYKICDSAIGEDASCSDSLITYNVFNHLFYFGIKIGNCGTF